MTSPEPVGSDDDLLTSADAARIAGVTARTVVRWHEGGMLAAHRTPGGHRRYRRGDVRALVGLTTEARTGTTEAGSLHRGVVQ